MSCATAVYKQLSAHGWVTKLCHAIIGLGLTSIALLAANAVCVCKMLTEGKGKESVFEFGAGCKAAQSLKTPLSTGARTETRVCIDINM